MAVLCPWGPRSPAHSARNEDHPPPHAPDPLQRGADAAFTQSRGETAGESAPSQASPASRRRSPGESRRGGGPERQPTRQVTGTPRQASCPPSTDPMKTVDRATAPPGGRLLPPFPRVQAAGEPEPPGSMAQSPPPPPLRVRGPGERRASSPALPRPPPPSHPCPGPGFRAPSSSRIASGASHPRAHHVCALGAAAPAPDKIGRRPGCEARRHAP